MVPIAVSYSTADNCNALTCTLSVTSNEPINGLGDGDTAPDWSITDAHNLLLRSERSGKGSGRVYTIRIDCVDAAGNHTIKTVTVNVPKSQARSSTGLAPSRSAGSAGSAPTTSNVTAPITATPAANRGSVYIPYLNVSGSRTSAGNNKARSSSARKKKRTRNTSVR
jgi:hypothetical protein